MGEIEITSHESTIFSSVKMCLSRQFDSWNMFNTTENFGRLFEFEAIVIYRVMTPYCLRLTFINYSVYRDTLYITNCHLIKFLRFNILFNSHYFSISVS